MGKYSKKHPVLHSVIEWDGADGKPSGKRCMYSIGGKHEDMGGSINKAQVRYPAEQSLESHRRGNTSTILCQGGLDAYELLFVDGAEAAEQIERGSRKASLNVEQKKKEAKKKVAQAEAKQRKNRSDEKSRLEARKKEKLMQVTHEDRMVALCTEESASRNLHIHPTHVLLHSPFATHHRQRTRQRRCASWTRRTRRRGWRRSGWSRSRISSAA